MKKKILSILGLSTAISLSAANISSEQCSTKGDEFIFAGGECIEFRAFEGDSEAINVIVHGTWPDGANTLGRYGPFAETINFNTDITTIAVALPGYSGSSTNNFTALAHEGVKDLAAKKEYVLFMGELIESLKEKYGASTVNYIGHSAAAKMGGTLTGLKPNLITNAMLVGGKYVNDEKNDKLIVMNDVLDAVSKDTNFIFVYGTADKISKPEVTTSFYEIAKKSGLKASIVKVEGAEHVDLDMTDPAVEAFGDLVSQ